MSISTPIAAPDAPAVHTPAALRRVVALTTVGNVLEWFDFSVYGFVAAYVGATFFPHSDPVAATLSGFAVFAVGFIARPLGAIILGSLVDRMGRKAVMLVSMFIMAFGSLLIAVAPSYHVSGIFGAVLIIIARLSQGFSAGGDYGSSGVFIVEWAHHGRRGFWSSFLSVASFGGLLLGVLLTALLTAIFGTPTMAAWAWRIPFVIGALIAVVAYFLRRKLEETPVYKMMKTDAAQLSANDPITKNGVGPVAGFLLAFGIMALWGVTSMVCLTYLPTYSTTFLKLHAQTGLWATAAGAALTLVLLPFAGALSDRIGRKVLLLFGTAGYIIAPIPLFAMMTSTHAAWSVFVTQLVLALFTAPIAGAGMAAMSELFSTKQRGLLVSLATASSIAIFGGFGTYIITWLIRGTGQNIAPGYYIVGVAVITLIAAILLPRGLERESLRD